MGINTKTTLRVVTALGSCGHLSVPLNRCPKGREAPALAAPAGAYGGLVGMRSLALGGPGHAP